MSSEKVDAWALGPVFAVLMIVALLAFQFAQRGACERAGGVYFSRDFQCIKGDNIRTIRP